MYAIIQTGGKQYRVEKDDVIDVELLDEAAENQIAFNDVLLVCDGTKTQVGSPFLAGFVVKGTLMHETKGPKIKTLKYKRGTHRRHFGHRQHYSRVKITEIIS